MNRTLPFAGKFLLILIGLVIALRLVGASFDFSQWAGFLVLLVIATFLYLTASHWVRWLPGLLIFGVINSLVALTTHHAPTNPNVKVPPWAAGLLIAFYMAGCVISYHYDAAHLSVADKLALLLFLFCMIFPALLSNNNFTQRSAAVAWSSTIGMTALIVAFVVHRIRLRKKP